LKDRKIVKEATAQWQTGLKEAGDVIGSTLNWDEANMTEVYKQSAADGEVERLDPTSRYQTSISYYAKCLKGAFEEIANEEHGKKALQDLMKDRKVELVPRPKNYNECMQYYIWTPTALQIEFKSDCVGYNADEYTAEALLKDLNVAVWTFNGHTWALKHKDDLLKVQPQIDSAMKTVSDAYGSELKWDPDYTQLRKNLMANNSDLWYYTQKDFPTRVKAYVDQVSKTLVEFVKDADNKEALTEKLDGSKTIDVTYVPNDHIPDVTYVWNDNGRLCMQIKTGQFGSYMDDSYYGQKNIEATL